jgi:hypothetical protein
MKTLSVQQPWASLILMGVKPVENRTWPAPPWLIGQRLAIHASGRQAVRSWADLLTEGPLVAFDAGVELLDGRTLPPLSSLPLSAVLGTVEVTACVRDTDLPPEPMRAINRQADDGTHRQAPAVSPRTAVPGDAWRRRDLALLRVPPGALGTPPGSA